MNLRYVLPRLIRHFLPQHLASLFLRRGWIIRPGLETAEPSIAVSRYCKALAEYDSSILGKYILVFGYGGFFAIGAELLRQGASHVVLLDKYAPPDHRRNLSLLPIYPNYLIFQQERVIPDSHFLTVLRADIWDVVVQRMISPVDIVLSSSVFEHLPINDIEKITASLAVLTKPDGVHLHFIDLRDHFFKFPFEMLTFSARVWRNWLNPTSNLNRFRYQDYYLLFHKYFDNVEIAIKECQPKEFDEVRSRIQPEFLTNNPDIDAATIIQVVTSSPKV